MDLFVARTKPLFVPRIDSSELKNGEGIAQRVQTHVLVFCCIGDGGRVEKMWYNCKGEYQHIHLVLSFAVLHMASLVHFRASLPVLGMWPYTLEILDEVQQSYPVDALEDSCDPGRMHNFQGPGGAPEEPNKYSQVTLLTASYFSLAR
jgi:hypothetical protein